MARYKGGVKGQSSTKVTRLGSPRSGLSVDANGWDCGAIVNMYPCTEDNSKDVVSVSLTGGSNCSHLRISDTHHVQKIVLTYSELQDKVWFHTDDYTPVTLHTGQVLRWSDDAQKYILEDEDVQND